MEIGKHMIDVLILAAGKQTRFENPSQKALMPYCSETILSHNLNLLNKLDFFSKYYIYCNHLFKDNFKSGILTTKIDQNVLSIMTNYRMEGKGSGLDCLDALKVMSGKNVLILWGDCIIKDKNFINDYVKDYIRFSTIENSISVPLYLKKEPYVQFTIVNDRIFDVKYSRFNEIALWKNFALYQDLGIFLGPRELFIYLLEGVKKFGVRGRNNEFLDIFNLSQVGVLFPATGLEIKSFNTMEEYYKCL